MPKKLKQVTSKHGSQRSYSTWLTVSQSLESYITDFKHYLNLYLLLSSLPSSGYKEANGVW